MGLKYVQPLFPFLLGMALILASQTFFAVGLVNSVLANGAVCPRRVYPHLAHRKNQLC